MTTKKTFFHEQILPVAPEALPNQKQALSVWVKNLEIMLEADTTTKEAALMHGALEKILGYSTEGDTITIALDKTPDEKFFNMYLGQFKPGGLKPLVGIKIVSEVSISEETEQSFVREAWRWTEFENNGYYCLTNLNEIRLYPRYRKDRSYERFVLSELVEDASAFNRFCQVLCAQNLLSGQTAKWIADSAIVFLDEKLHRTHKSLKESYGAVYQGLPEFEQAFIVDSKTREAAIRADDNCYHLFKPLHSKGDLDKWQTDLNDQWIIYIPEGKYNIDDFPSIKQILEPKKAILEKRGGTQKWYEHPAGDADRMLNEKMGFSVKSHNPTFAIDKNGGIYDASGLYMSDYDYYLVALMNSTVLWYLIRKASTKKEDGTYEISAQAIEQLPIPDANGLIRGRLGQLSSFCHETIEERNQSIKFFRGQTKYNLLPDGLESVLTPKLHNWFSIDFEDFRKEINEAFNTDIPEDDLQLWDDYFYQEKNKIFDANVGLARAEKEIDDTSYELFDLTQDEIDLIERFI